VPCFITDSGLLNLDDVGAKIAQNHGAVGACQDPGQVEYANAGE
jgi:hypothetical protein